MKKKIYLSICVTIMIFTLLSTTVLAEKELTFWHVGTEIEGKAIKAVLSDFEIRNNLKVRIETVGWNEAHTKYLTAIAGGVTPDVVTMGLTWGNEFGAKGAMIELKSKFSKSIQSLEEQTFKGLWQALEWNNKIYGVPFDMTLQLLFYRKDMIEQPPTTWDELTENLERLSLQNKTMIFGWGSMNWMGYAPFLWQNGGSFYNEEGTEATLDTPKAIESAQFFAGLYNNYGVSRSNQDVATGIRSGDAPLGIGGNWIITYLETGAQDIAGKWDIAMLPGKNGKRTAFIGGRIMGIFKDTNYPELSWELIRYLNQPNIQKEMYEINYKNNQIYLPPNMLTWSSLSMKPAFRNVIMKQAMDAQAPPAVPSWTNCEKFVNESLQRIIITRADPVRELKKADAKMERELE